MAKKTEQPLKPVSVKMTDDDHHCLKQLALDDRVNIQDLVQRWIHAAWAKREGSNNNGNSK